MDEVRPPIALAKYMNQTVLNLLAQYKDAPRIGKHSNPKQRAPLTPRMLMATPAKNAKTQFMPYCIPLVILTSRGSFRPPAPTAPTPELGRMQNGGMDDAEGVNEI